ncbi:MAG: trypsin-like peptidase domain-containing protein [Planctomycetia bacterium]|nr:trypsin-like peptidase domain-containing protein [Planctomycetia bacterium]
MTSKQLRWIYTLLALVAGTTNLSRADEPAKAESPAAPVATEPTTLSVEQLTESVRKSVVVVTVTGRDGKQQGLGSGFVVAADGLIATNLHVIGEGRAINVQFADGRKFDVTAVHAFDRPLDLALIRIDAKDLPPLPLGDSSSLKQGQPIVAIGNPHGLKHSVVTGVVSGTREIEGRQMIQLAIPIEPGNSGGPLLDMQGRVHGLLTMKSAVTQNLGFAMPVNALKALVAKPNPTLMSRWLTIGALDPQEWSTLFGANWRQRAGRILVDGLGSGFGGRSICLAQSLPPEPPFEIGVTVKLDREEGAAGLVFCADGGDVHYGFYPTNGKLRLSRFDGPDVYSWNVLAEVQNPHYKPGDWNSLKVRFERGKIQCFVNDVAAIESTDGRLAAGKVGLAKFRTTEAQFRAFRVAKELSATRPAEDVAARLKQLIDELPADAGNRPEAAGKLADDAASVAALRERAIVLEQQAQQLKKLAQSVHQRRVEKEFARLFEKPNDDEVDLFHAALLVAFLDNDEVDVDGYRDELHRMAREITRELAPESDEAARLAALNKYLFDEHGFHGSRGDYYHRSNSYVNEVLDDREGLPITLSVIYIELARKIGLKVVGMPFPGHFMVRFEPSQGDAQIIDVFERGQPVPRADAEVLIVRAHQRPATDADFAPATKRAIVVRMLHNLLGGEQKAGNIDGMLRYLGAILAVSPNAGQERFMRGVLLLQTGRRAEAEAEADWLLQHRPEGVNLNEVDELRRILERLNRENK